MQAAALCGLAASAKPGWRADGISTGGEKTAGTQGLTQFVDVFIGTGGHGHTFPGATVPFWMVQLSPNTWTGGWDHCSGDHLTTPGRSLCAWAQPNEKFGAAGEDRPPSFA